MIWVIWPRTRVVLGASYCFFAGPCQAVIRGLVNRFWKKKSHSRLAFGVSKPRRGFSDNLMVLED